MTRHCFEGQLLLFKQFFKVYLPSSNLSISLYCQVHFTWDWVPLRSKSLMNTYSMNGVHVSNEIWKMKRSNNCRAEYILTLELEVVSRKQSRQPKPSAAKQNFCCLCWADKVHRSASSSFYIQHGDRQRTERQKTQTIQCTPQDKCLNICRVQIL